MEAGDDSSAVYARHVVSLLWPEPHVVGHTYRGREGHRGEEMEWLLLPDPRSPTLLVPCGVPAAATMLQRHGDRLLPRLGRASLSRAFGSGLLERLPVPRIQILPPAEPAESVMDLLAEVLPGATLIGLILGTPRPNRKPVLRVFAEDGSTLAFAKVGIDATTRELVRTETENLMSVHAASLRSLEAPEVLHHGPFRSLELLVLSPMESSQQRRAASLPITAMRELAGIGRSGPHLLIASPYREGLADRLGRAAGRPGGVAASGLLDRLTVRWGDAPLMLGSWHGDWAPWNMGHRGDVVQLWDWERFATGVPIGFDAIHFRAQGVRHGRGDTHSREAALRAEVPHLLRQMGPPAEDVEPDLMLSLYLLELWARFAEMGSDSATIHPRARWALDFAGSLVR